jgi:hypothetical protein
MYLKSVELNYKNWAFAILYQQYLHLVKELYVESGDINDQNAESID